MRTHYDLLGVGPDATVEEIQRAYRLLALRHHPDVAPDVDMTVMAAINDAWAVLSDADRRRTYDASLRRIETEPTAAPPVGGMAGQAAADDNLDPVSATHFIRDVLAPAVIDPDDLSDEPYSPGEHTPADMLVMTPVLLVIAAVGVFFFSVMSGSEALRTFAILLLPVAGLGFVMAPLIVMLRSRSR